MGMLKIIGDIILGAVIKLLGVLVQGLGKLKELLNVPPTV